MGIATKLVLKGPVETVQWHSGSIVAGCGAPRKTATVRRLLASAGIRAAWCDRSSLPADSILNWQVLPALVEHSAGACVRKRPTLHQQRWTSQQPEENRLHRLRRPFHSPLCYREFAPALRRTQRWSLAAERCPRNWPTNKSTNINRHRATAIFRPPFSQLTLSPAADPKSDH